MTSQRYRHCDRDGSHPEPSGQVSPSSPSGEGWGEWKHVLIPYPYDCRMLSIQPKLTTAPRELTSNAPGGRCCTAAGICYSAEAVGGAASISLRICTEVPGGCAYHFFIIV